MSRRHTSYRNTILSGFKPNSIPSNSVEKTWTQQVWFKVLPIIWAACIIVVSVISNASLVFVAEACILLLMSVFALVLLEDTGMLNPLQAIIWLFYLWFGVAPTVTGMFYLFVRHDHDAALQAQECGAPSLLVVSFGLMLYAIVCRLTLRLLKTIGIKGGILAVQDTAFSKETLIYLFVVSLVSRLLLLVMSILGIVGVENVNYLGGTRTLVWWIGIIDLMRVFETFALYGCIWSFVNFGKRMPRIIAIMTAYLVLQTVILSLGSASKGSMLIVPAAFLIAFTCKKNRPPWGFAFFTLILFLTVIEPFVAYSRYTAEIAGAVTASDRSAAIRESRSLGVVKTNVEDFTVEAIFRGIYPLAGAISSQNSMFSGEWSGETILLALDIVTPRVFVKNKTEESVGNLYARTYGASIGTTNASDTFTSVAIGTPFDFVQNFGLMAGVASFGVIAFGWTLLVVLYIGYERMSKQPICGYLVITSLVLEQPFSGVIVVARSLITIAVVIYITRFVFLRKQIARGTV